MSIQVRVKTPGRDSRLTETRRQSTVIAVMLGATCVAFAGGVIGRDVPYVYHRASVAFDTTPGGTTQLPPDTPVVVDVASVTTSDGVYRRGGGPNGDDIYPLARNSQFLIGRGDDQRLYRSADGTTWESVGLHYTDKIWTLADDTLIRTATRPPADGRQALFRSTDHGQTWQPGKFAGTGDDFMLLTPGAFLHYWGLHQALNGTVVIVEYRIPNGGRYIYRSADGGANWQVVHDIDPGSIYHYHAVGKQEALGRWIASTGDQPLSHRMPVSDDDGLTWHDYLQPPGQRRAQPIALRDYGHPTRMLYGSDEGWQVAWMDFSDGPTGRSIESLTTQLNPLGPTCYIWDLFTQGGLYYASSWDYESTERNPVILVSPDLANWTIYHRFTNGEYGAYRYTGFIGGRMHILANARTSYEDLVLSPARVRIDQGRLVAGAVTNLLGPELSSAESTAGWVNISQVIGGSQGLFEHTTDIAHSGAGCVHYTRSDGGLMRLATPSTTAVGGTSYQFRFWVRGLTETSVAQVMVDGAVNATLAGFEPMSDRWLEVLTSPVELASGAHQLGLQFTSYSNSDHTLELLIDSLQLETVPGTPWQPGGTPRAPAYLEATMPSGGGWTNVFSIQPDVIREYLTLPADVQIKSFIVDDLTRLDLVFDPLNYSFKLRPMIGGVIQPPIATSRQHFHRKHQIRFAVRCYGGYCYGLSVSNGQPVEHLIGGFPAPAGPSVTVRAGSADAAERVLPYVLYNDRWFDGCLSDGQIAALLDELGDDAGAPGDTNCDGQVDADDSAPLTLAITDPAAYQAQYPTCPLANADVNRDGAANAADLTALLALLVGPPIVRGDMNCDGRVNENDIDPFMLALQGEAAYAAAYPACRWLNADCNYDGLVDAGDVAPFNVLIYGPPPPKGDLNCDDQLDFADIDPFVLALFGPAGYYAAYPACDILLADCNCDGIVDFFDIDPFVECLAGNCACP
jgi:hypothetical protein